MLYLSIRKYAGTLGVSHTAVAKAIKAHHIVKGWDLNEKKIIVEFADNEWGNGIKEKIQVKQTSGTFPGESNFHESYLDKNDHKPINGNITFSEARRRKEVNYAEIARITALKEQGVYVEKEMVYSQLFEFGQNVRTALQLLPDRWIDKIIVARSRAEAHAVLLNAINDTLEALTTYTAI